MSSNQLTLAFHKAQNWALFNYLICINDLPDQVKSDTFMFADDTSVMRTLSNPYADTPRANADLKQISN